MEKLLIKNIMVADPEKDETYVSDILCENGKIARIAEFIDEKEADNTIDGKGLYAAPGFVDIHVHFRDPGFTHKEDIYTGAKAAAKGGFTTVVLMANTKPAVDSVETLDYVMKKGSETAINIYSAATVTKGMRGEELTDMNSLYQSGAVGFTDDGKPILDDTIVREAMLKVKELNVPISFHEENPQFISNNGINEGEASSYLGIKGSPRDAEIDLIKRDLEIALETGATINIQHISSKEGVMLVRMAKKRANGDIIHAEATPHHFSLTEEAVKKYGSNAKMNPPLRTEEDRQAIIEGLSDGTIDLIATDHAPHSIEEKSAPITEAPSGIIGLETALSLGITNLVSTGRLTLIQMIRKMTINPAKLYNLSCGRLCEGAVADICIFSMDEECLYDSFASKSSNTPFKGTSLKGKVKYTVCGGNIIYHDAGEK